MSNKSLRVLVLHYIAKMMGILIKIDGMPYGSSKVQVSSSLQSTFSKSN